MRAKTLTVCFLSLLALLSLPFPAAAQVRTTGEIHGVVTDPSGNVVPGAQVDVTDTATGIAKSLKTEADGSFLFLGLTAGKYNVKVTATGFQVALYSDVVVETARRTDLPVALKVGQLTETVEVKAAAVALETTSNQIASTVRNDYVQQLPLSGRDTLYFSLLSAGAQAIDGGRTSTFDGLPNASMNITLDGINNNSQRFKSGGTSMYGFAPVRVDAIDEISVSTTGQGADASGGGAMNIRFVTKRGTEQYHGKVFEQFRNDALNANSFFNNMRGTPKTKQRLNDFGGNIGGPLPVPFLGLNKKLFFFLNFEASPVPGTATASTTVFNPDYETGIYKYIGTDGALHSVNVLQIAGAAGYQSTIDPTVQKFLSQIDATKSQGTLVSAPTTPNFSTLYFNRTSTVNSLFPTARVDYQITPKISWTGAWNLRWQHNLGYPNYPGGPLGNAYKITAYVASNALNWTITPAMLNQFNFGVQSNVELFYEDNDIHQWSAYGDRRLHIPGLTDYVPNMTPWIRNNPVYNLYDNLSWVRDRHTLTFGVSYLQTSFYETTWNNAGVLNWNLGAASGDPISGVLNASVMPAVSSNDVGGAATLYALLTGRISSISGSLNVDEKTHRYEKYAPITQRWARRSAGLYAQDSFRLRPDLTLNYGFRWEISGAINSPNGINTVADWANWMGPSTALFQPGVVNGVANPVVNATKDFYKSDKINPAPNFGFAWSPKFADKGFIGKLFGENTVIRGSYAISYYDEGLNSLSNYESGNPGTTQQISLNPGDAGFSPGGLSLTSTLPPWGVMNPPSFSFPMPVSLFTTFGNSLSIVNPTLHTPYVQNWSFGIQRQVAPGTIVEVRYVGNRSNHMWSQYTYSETNIFENNFLTEFKNAQNNLAINRANNKGATFANNGLPGQVALPILQAAFGPLGSMSALSAGQGFASSSFVSNLDQGAAGTMANTLATNATYFCRLIGNQMGPCASRGYNAPGAYPINLFKPNPYANTLYRLADDGVNNYNGLQIEFRKAYSHGLTVNANYTFSKTLGNLQNASNQAGESTRKTLRNHRLDYGPTPFDLRHVFQTYWTYSLPFGPGRRVAVANPVLRRVVGDWTVSSIIKWTSGRNYLLPGSYYTVNQLTNSGVVLTGMTYSQLSAAMSTISSAPAATKAMYFVDPKLIGADGRAISSTLSSASTPGQFGQFLYMYGPSFMSWDAALQKEIPVREQMRFTFQVEALNAFNHPVFGVSTSNANPTSTTFGQTTGTAAGNSPRSVQLRGSFQW
jgi:hypothetical protein